MKTRVKPATELLLTHPVIKELAARFDAKGHQLFIVGGAVRDAILGSLHEDIDCATDATPDEMRDLVCDWAENIWDVGAKFGTLALSKNKTHVEITTFRSETYQPESRKPTVKLEASIYTDLSRRDFTINSMAVDAVTGRFLDPYNGLSDLDARLLRTPISPEQSFADDPLRILRAFRFSSTLITLPSPEVLDAIRAMKERLEVVSRERIKDELSKLLVGLAPTPALHLMVDTGVMAYIFPEVMELAYSYDPEHRHKDLLEHTLTVVERTPADLALRLAALLHDVGKPSTKIRTADGIHFYHHEVVGAKMASKRLRELRFPSALVQEVSRMIDMHMRFHTYRLGWTDHAVRKYVRDCDSLLEKVNALVRADCTTRNPFQARKYERLMDELEARIKQLEQEEETAKIRPPIDGNELMAYLNIKPGPQVGEILKALLEERLAGKIMTREEAYAFVDQWIAERQARKPGN